MLNIGLYHEMEFKKSQREEVSEKWLKEEYGSPVFLTGQQISDFALESHRDSNKALVVVNISDTDLSKLKTGFSASLFVASRTMQAIKDFTSAGYIVYSNKTKHKVYRVQGDNVISIQAYDGYLRWRYAELLKEQFPERKDRDEVKPDFHLSFAIDPVEVSLGLSQAKINKIPEGLSGYDMHIAELVSLKG